MLDFFRLLDGDDGIGNKDRHCRSTGSDGKLLLIRHTFHHLNAFAAGVFLKLRGKAKTL